MNPNTILCPACWSDVNPDALNCPHCGKLFFEPKNRAAVETWDDALDDAVTECLVLAKQAWGVLKALFQILKLTGEIAQLLLSAVVMLLGLGSLLVGAWLPAIALFLLVLLIRPRTVRG